MRGGTRTKDYRKLAAGIGFSAILPAGPVWLLTALGLLAVAAPLFAQSVSFNTGGTSAHYAVPSPEPTTVAVGSLRSNGILDLVVANASGGSSGGVSVLLGNGDGTFQPAVNYATNLQCYSVALGDFNGDGIPDLAITKNSPNNTTPGSVSILLGNGDGTFQAPVSYTLGQNPNWVAVGSLRGNGILDLVVVNEDQIANSGYVSILLGNGDGTFQPAVNYAAGPAPVGVALSDFTGTGKLDVVVANYANQSAVSVLMGNGDGTFQPLVSHPLTSADHGSMHVAVGDFNGDGKPDLAVTNQSGGPNVTVLLGNGDGTFQPPVDYSVVPSFEPTGTQYYTETLGVAVGDFNGDGKLDLAVGTYSNAVCVLMGNGDGTFQAPVAFESIYLYPYSGPVYPFSIAVGDFTGDGKPDLAVADNADGGYVNVLLNTTGWLPATTTTLQSSVNPSYRGQSVTFTAAVSGAGGIPTGTVTFYDGATSLSTGTILGTGTLSSGAATFTTSALAVGSHSITVFYGSDSSFSSSTSTVLKQSVQVPAPVAGVSPPSLMFGNQNLGTTSTSQPVTLSNTTGTAALTITSISISANFGETNNCGGSVAIGGSCTINVTFSPSLTATLGTLNGTLTVTDNSNGVVGNMQTVSLSGTATSSGGGGPPPVSLTDNETITVTDTPVVVAMPALLTDTAPVAYYSVGSLGFGGQTQTLPLTVSNLGQANLTLDAVASPGSPFSIAQMACTNGAISLPTTLPPAGACIFSISYVAPPSGTPTGTITFTDNAALSNLTSTASASNFTQSIALSGAGTSTAPPGVPQAAASVNETVTVTDTPVVVAMPALLTDTAPVAYYSVGSLGFGGQTQTLPLTVSNLGQANLTLDARDVSRLALQHCPDRLHQWGIILVILAHNPPARRGPAFFPSLTSRHPRGRRPGPSRLPTTPASVMSPARQRGRITPSPFRSVVRERARRHRRRRKRPLP